MYPPRTMKGLAISKLVLGVIFFSAVVSLSNQPINTTLKCNRANQICSLNIHHFYPSSDIFNFEFSDVLFVAPLLTQTGRRQTYGILLHLKQRDVLIDGYSVENQAAENSQKIISYLHNPTSDVLIVDPHAEGINIFSMVFCVTVTVLCLFSSLLCFIVSNKPETSIQVFPVMQERKKR